MYAPAWVARARACSREVRESPGPRRGWRRGGQSRWCGTHVALEVADAFAGEAAEAVHVAGEVAANRVRVCEQLVLAAVVAKHVGLRAGVPVGLVVREPLLGVGGHGGESSWLG